MSPLRVLVLVPDPPEGLLAAKPDDHEVEMIIPPDRSTETLHELLPTVDVIIGDWSGQTPLREAEAALATNVRLVQQPVVGVESIDLHAFAEHKIPVANIGPANAASVAEWCLGAALNLARSFRWSDARVRTGDWPQLEILNAERPRELGAMNVGVVGAGQVASRCATVFNALGSTVRYWSPRSRLPEEIATRAELPELFESSDLVVVAIARAPETLGLVSADLVARIPHGGMVIDVSRGGIVDQDAVLVQVENGALIGAALDVYASEPPVLESRWRDHERILFSPHVAGVTHDAIGRAYDTVATNLRAIAKGLPVVNVVNGVGDHGHVG